MKLLQKKLLVELKESREEVINTLESSSRKEKLISIFTTVETGFNGPIATNFREHIEHMLALSGYDIDNIISFLQGIVDNSFDEITLSEDLSDGFDDRYGTETSMIYDQLELPEHVSTERLRFSTRFHPSPTRAFRHILRTLQEYVENYDKWLFIDIGCGLGRNLLLASEHPFKRIIGVEISPFLCSKAIANIAKYDHSSHCSCIAEVVCTDILEYAFPKNDSILYFWEPFREFVIMERLLQILEEKARQNNTKFILVFLGTCYLDHIRPASFIPINLKDQFKASGSNKTINVSFYANFS